MATESRPSSESLRVRRETSAELRADCAGVAAAIGAWPVVSTKVSATRRPVSCSRASQKRAPVTDPWSRRRRKRPSDTGAPGTRRGPRTMPADIGGGTGEELKASWPNIGWISAISGASTSMASPGSRIIRDMPGMRRSACARFCTSGRLERLSTRPVAMTKTTPTMTRWRTMSSGPIGSGRMRSSRKLSAPATTRPARPAPVAHRVVSVTALPPRLPSFRLSRNAPMTAPATKPKPFAAPRMITTCEVLLATIGASSESTTLVKVMPAMMKVGVHASSRA